ncbi:ATP-binding protein [Pseudobdellovibrio sp. HCB154]|uniref:ATP-binding protein n=1 Tax=Pseudobdellovibrio sp. HCB154 TaxID=3386277 RepID=UPI0039170FF5
MSDDHRPDPDALLKTVDEMEKRRHEGRLRIFLGMSAGVGKTYAMLRAAHQRLKEGVDVTVGIVETHGRSETTILTEGLPHVDRKKVHYRGADLEELDIDAILKLKPELVIVDELAHTNVPGSRHEKRYQDVLEILEAGIDVYTAFNVQHLESRKDSVEAITGVSIRETVPDSILEKATLVELVDIAPSELLKRLKEGKVYLGDKAERAAQNFFKEDKLTALREIALRMTAERVDQDLQKLVSVRAAGSPWQTNERLLVAVSHSPYSEKLIRATRRLAYNLEAPWIAVHVDTGLSLNDTDQAQLVKNLNLARELKAEVITTTEVDVPSAVRRICRQKNVTQVVVGRPTRRWFRDLLEKGNLLEGLIHESLDVDVHVIRQEGASLQRPSLIDEISYYSSKTGPAKYWYTLMAIIAVAGFGTLIEKFIGYRAVGFIFLLAVVVLSTFGSIGAVILAATLSTLIWNYFFIPPKFTFFIGNTEDILMCVAFFVVALITGFLTNRLKYHERLIREREERTNILYEILQDIAAATEKSEFLHKVTQRVGHMLEANCGVLLKSPTGVLEFDELKPYHVDLAVKDCAVAQWCFDNNKQAGWSTETLSEAAALFLPLRGPSEIVGVFVFKPKRRTRKLDLEKENLLLSIVRQLGVSIQRHFLSRRLSEAQRLKDSEKLHQTLLSSISHEMRTPLTAILGAASALEQESTAKDSAQVKTVALGLHEAADRLNRVIENLLDMSRLNSGVLSLKLEWHDCNDLLGVVIKKLEKPLSQHKVNVQFLENIVLLKVDYRLMEHALANIVLNAAIYTPPGSEINIKLKKLEDEFNIVIEDNGPGIPEESLTKVFDKFYRVPGSPTGGTGLGLSIVKSIVELHQGSIHVENVIPHGARFIVSLPLEEQPSLPNEVNNG